MTTITPPSAMSVGKDFFATEMRAYSSKMSNFSWTALISVGIFNLLPVPVLDGGHLLFYGIEAVRGRPVSPAFRERAQMVGVMLLVALMLFVFVLDVGRCVVHR